MLGFLVNAGIKPDQFAFYDGSGLSREDLVTPGAVVALLRYCHQQPWGQLYEGTLPVAGVETLALRALSQHARCRIHFCVALW